MPTSLIRLGALVQTFREAKQISQEELAVKITPATNRSAIAHLEQGLRLPKPEVLRGLCDFLGIPDIVWNSLELISGDQGARLYITEHEKPQIIAVCGMMGSGKTTLARNLANALGYVYIPESMPAKQYLGDLSADPNRWAFETQLAFLCYKFLHISNAVKNAQRIIIDRSLDEDINIFAKHWKKNGNIDERAFAVYSALAGYFLSTVPKPEMLVYCECSFETACSRVEERNRGDHKLHSKENLRILASTYEQWIASQTQAVIYNVDSEKIDWRQSKTASFQTLVQSLLNLWIAKISRTNKQFQLELFENKSNNSIKPLSFGLNPQLQTVDEFSSMIYQSFEIKKSRLAERKPLPNLVLTRPYPSSYIAAPFTGKAVQAKKAKLDLTLFGDLSQHGVIPRGRYRNMLTNLGRSLGKLGISTLLPHRDINHWGTVLLTPTQVMELCTSQVAGCDIFVGILGESHGAHYEFGIARGMNKPTIIIHCREIVDSFIGKGLTEGNYTLLILSCDKIQQIPSLLSTEAVINFLSQFIPLNRD